MNNLQEIIKQVNQALTKPDDEAAVATIREAMQELHLQLTRPKWAIEDEKLREEYEKLFVSWATQEYLRGRRV